MTTIDLTGYITENGELQAELPKGLPSGLVQITLTLPEAEPSELLKFHPVSGAEIVAAIRSGELDTSAWTDITDHTSAVIGDDPRYQAAEKRIRPKLYARARRYWQQTGNQERLALSDAQLDEQFWLFDEDGVPRLKSDQAVVTLSEDPLEKAANQAWQMALKEGRIAEVGTQDFDTRAILQNEYPEYLMRRMQANNGE